MQAFLRNHFTECFVYVFSFWTCKIKIKSIGLNQLHLYLDSHLLYCITWKNFINLHKIYQKKKQLKELKKKIVDATSKNLFALFVLNKQHT